MKTAIYKGYRYTVEETALNGEWLNLTGIGWVKKKDCATGITKFMYNFFKVWKK